MNKNFLALAVAASTIALAACTASTVPTGSGDTILDNSSSSVEAMVVSSVSSVAVVVSSSSSVEAMEASSAASSL